MPDIRAVRNYPFRGKIYTAKQIDELLENIEPDLSNYYTKSEVDELIEGIDLSDYYDKTDIDGIIDNVESAIDTKQDELTAGDNISIINNVISAIISGGNDYIKVTPKTWQNFKDDTDLDAFYLAIMPKSGNDILLIIKKINTTQFCITPIFGATSPSRIYSMATLGTIEYGTFNLNYIDLPQQSSFNGSTVSLKTLNGTVIDSSNIDTYYNSVTGFNTDIVVTYHNSNRYYVSIISANITPNENASINTHNGNCDVPIEYIYNAIKTGSGIAIAGKYLIVGGANSNNVSAFSNFYKLDFPTTN